MPVASSTCQQRGAGPASGRSSLHWPLNASGRRLPTGHRPLPTAMIFAIRCGFGSYSLSGAGSLTTMHRWTARFLLLVMLVPAVGPLGLARVPPPAPMHCMRRPLAATPAAEPAMHCHHGASQTAPPTDESQAAPSPISSEASLRSLDCCCGRHCDCCRNSKASEWARPASNHLSFVGLLIESGPPAAMAPRVPTFLAGPDSARAPPRS